ncbi:MAG: hypothetical protein RLN78_05600 [Phycisphaerales bacterium]
MGEGGELWEGEAVDLADEDGGHRGIEEVFEERFGKRGRSRERRIGESGGGGRGALTPALSHQNGRGRKS